MVCKFCRDAGFLRSDLRKAIAIALTASEGNDAFKYESPSNPADIYQGLFGIPQTDIPDTFKGNVYDPLANAKLAHNLWRMAGKQWDWSPYYAGGVWRSHLEVAREAILTPPSPQESPLITNRAQTKAQTDNVVQTVKHASGWMIEVGNAARSIPSR
jgi:hypothetical protein